MNARKPIKSLDITPDRYSIRVAEYQEISTSKEQRPINYVFHIVENGGAFVRDIGGIGMHVRKNEPLNETMKRLNLMIHLEAQKSPAISSIQPVYSEADYGRNLVSLAEHYGFQTGRNASTIETLESELAIPGNDFDLYVLDCWATPDFDYHGGWKEAVQCIDTVKPNAKILIAAICAPEIAPEANEMGIPVIDAVDIRETLEDLAKQREFKQN